MYRNWWKGVAEQNYVLKIHLPDIGWGWERSKRSGLIPTQHLAKQPTKSSFVIMPGGSALLFKSLSRNWTHEPGHKNIENCLLLNQPSQPSIVNSDWQSLSMVSTSCGFRIFFYLKTNWRCDRLNLLLSADQAYVLSLPQSRWSCITLSQSYMTLLQLQLHKIKS